RDNLSKRFRRAQERRDNSAHIEGVAPELVVSSDHSSQGAPEILNPTSIGIAVFVFTFGGALLGLWLRTGLSERQLNAESKDTVRLGVGLIATMTALVLGLVTASAKTSFDAVDAGIRQYAIDLLALDRVLARYGSDTGEIRNGLQRAIGVRIDMIWG